MNTWAYSCLTIATWFWTTIANILAIWFTATIAIIRWARTIWRFTWGATWWSRIRAMFAILTFLFIWYFATAITETNILICHCDRHWQLVIGKLQNYIIRILILINLMAHNTSPARIVPMILELFTIKLITPIVFIEPRLFLNVS